MAAPLEQKRIDYYLHISLISRRFGVDAAAKPTNTPLRLISHFFQRASDGEHEIGSSHSPVPPTPRSFLRALESFPNSSIRFEDFLRHLRRKSNPAGSRVYDSISTGWSNTPRPT